MDCSKLGFSVHHQLLELAQTHVRQVSDTIQTSHRLSSLSPPAFNLSQHQGLFQWANPSHQVAKVLEFQLQHQSFQWIFRVDFFYDWLIWYPCCPSQESSPAPQFESISSLALSLFLVQLSHLYMTTGKIIALTRWAFVSKVMSLLFNTLSSIVTAFLPRSSVIPLHSHSHVVQYLLSSPFYRWKMWEINRLIWDHPACTSLSYNQASAPSLKRREKPAWKYQTGPYQT